MPHNQKRLIRVTDKIKIIEGFKIKCLCVYISQPRYTKFAFCRLMVIATMMIIVLLVNVFKLSIRLMSNATVAIENKS